MKHPWTLVIAVVLILAGLAGVGVVLGGRAVSPIVTRPPTGVGPGTMPRFYVPRGPGALGPGLSGPDASLGARIYLDGVGADGGPVPRTAYGPGMMGGGCVICHGIDGKGGRFRMMMASFDAPDITYATLTSPHDDEPAWTDEQIRAAITEGVEPDGRSLDLFMPRWDLTEQEFGALLDYLKELSQS